MKKIVFILTFVLTICLISVGKVKADTPNYIDMYLIAGQSNAVGYSYCYGQNSNTYANIMYAGELEERFRENGGKVARTNLDSFATYNQEVTTGLGADKNHIGPEYGMASILNNSYSAKNKAIIYKYAAGGTSLLDNTQELSSAFGNWYPSSLWEEGYTPDIEHCYAGNDATGLLYYAFIKNFEKVYNELISQGYTPVVKGMAWMQGCCNLYPTNTFPEYKYVLKELIKSVRNDIYAITGNLDDKSMPFVIGKIPTSFGAWANSNVPGMNEAQQGAADEMDQRVATIETADLILVDQDGRTVGSDIYHFNFNDSVTLGQRFANKILELLGKSATTIYCKNGSYELDGTGNDRVIKISGNEHYILTKFDVNGVDKLDLVENGEAPLPDEGSQVVDIVYTEKVKHTVTYNVETNKGGGIQLQPTKCYDGESLSLKIFVNEGYEITQLDFDGDALEYNTDKKTYDFFVNNDGVLTLKIEKTGGTTPVAPPVTPDEPTNSGCENAMAVFYSLLTVGAVVVFFRKKHF